MFKKFTARLIAEVQKLLDDEFLSLVTQFLQLLEQVDRLYQVAFS